MICNWVSKDALSAGYVNVDGTMPVSYTHLRLNICTKRYQGRFLYIYLIFLSTFLAVLSLIEIMFIFLLG